MAFRVRLLRPSMDIPVWRIRKLEGASTLMPLFLLLKIFRDTSLIVSKYYTNKTQQELEARIKYRAKC